jgi:hypothetical protein
LFYLRGVAPKEVKTSDIYWGALPWVGMQLVLVALVIAFPQQVTMFLDAPQHFDLDKVKMDAPQIDYGTGANTPEIPGEGMKEPSRP